MLQKHVCNPSALPGIASRTITKTSCANLSLPTDKAARLSASTTALSVVLAGCSASRIRFSRASQNQSRWTSNYRALPSTNASVAAQRVAKALEKLEAQKAAEISQRIEVVGQQDAQRQIGTSTSSRSPPEAQANFSRIYEKEEWGVEARSGLGSREDTTREFRSFLENFLKENNITSIVDAGCGHWPSGYQRFMKWQGVHYLGVDVVPFVVAENNTYFKEEGILSSYGLASAECMAGDVSDDLPAGDLLMVKDVLFHLPNTAIHSFLQRNLNERSPKYRMIMLVQNDIPPVPIREMIDIEHGQLLPFDIALPPFSAPFKPIFKWKSDEPKVVQLWQP